MQKHDFFSSCWMLLRKINDGKQDFFLSCFRSCWLFSPTAPNPSLQSRFRAKAKTRPLPLSQLAKGKSPKWLGENPWRALDLEPDLLCQRSLVLFPQWHASPLKLSPQTIKERFTFEMLQDLNACNYEARVQLLGKAMARVLNMGV